MLLRRVLIGEKKEEVFAEFYQQPKMVGGELWQRFHSWGRTKRKDGEFEYFKLDIFTLPLEEIEHTGEFVEPKIVRY